MLRGALHACTARHTVAPRSSSHSRRAASHREGGALCCLTILLDIPADDRLLHCPGEPAAPPASLLGCQAGRLGCSDLRHPCGEHLTVVVLAAQAALTCRTGTAGAHGRLLGAGLPVLARAAAQAPGRVPAGLCLLQAVRGPQGQAGQVHARLTRSQGKQLTATTDLQLLRQPLLRMPLSTWPHRGSCAAHLSCSPAQCFSEESLQFQERISQRNGLSEQTYLPMGLHYEPPVINMSMARQEASMVLNGAVTEVLQRTGKGVFLQAALAQACAQLSTPVDTEPSRSYTEAAGLTASAACKLCQVGRQEHAHVLCRHQPQGDRLPGRQLQPVLPHALAVGHAGEPVQDALQRCLLQPGRCVLERSTCCWVLCCLLAAVSLLWQHQTGY